jgi:uncharacterized protein
LFIFTVFFYGVSQICTPLELQNCRRSPPSTPVTKAVYSVQNQRLTMSLFTPVQGLIGGSLIGLSAATLLLFNGDIMGASGIVSTTLLQPRKTLSDSSMLWRSVFIASFLLTSQLFLGNNAKADPLMQRPPMVSALGYVIGGFLVGFGTKLGNGCTSGHGICGMARLSKRSFVAVASFMTTAFITSFLVTGPLAPRTEFLRSDETPVFESVLGNAITVLSVLGAIFHSRATPAMGVAVQTYSNHRRKTWPAMAAGALFAIGLSISGMIFSAKVHGFLNLSGISDGSFDPTLATVMGGGALVSFLSYQMVKGHNVVKHSNTMDCPLALNDSCAQTGKFSVPSSTTVDAQLLLGAAMFGVGWGVAGLCPGPALFHAATGSVSVVSQWWPAFWAGSYLAQSLKNKLESK